MTSLLVDTSVLIKWFHADGESDVREARALRDASARGAVDAKVIDLALYEMGNVLLRALRWSASDTADQLEDLVVICGAPIAMAGSWFRGAALIGESHGLTYYDACWAAAARALGIPLVSADTRLVAAGLAESPRSAATRLALVEP